MVPLMHIRDLRPSDAAALRAFRCATGNSWTRVVEVAIRDDLGMLIENGWSRAMGSWIDEELAGVVAWRPYGSENSWKMDLLASSFVHRRKGVAKALYLRLIERALSEEIRLVFASVDRRNEPMIQLQELFGAVSEVDPNDVDSLLCVLATVDSTGGEIQP